MFLAMIIVDGKQVMMVVIDDGFRMDAATATGASERNEESKPIGWSPLRLRYHLGTSHNGRWRERRVGQRFLADRLDSMKWNLEASSASEATDLTAVRNRSARLIFSFM